MAGVKYFFEYDLERGRAAKATYGNSAIRYFNSEKGPTVEIGDGYRNIHFLAARQWNGILTDIKKGNLNEDTIEGIVRGLMGLTEHEANNLIDAIEMEEIKEIPEFN